MDSSFTKQVQPDLKIQILRALFDRSYRSCDGDHIRLVVGSFKQDAETGARRHFRGALLVVTDKEDERQAVEWLDHSNVVRQLKRRRSQLAELARSRVTADEFYEALYEITETTLPLEEGLNEDSADNEEESLRRIRFIETLQTF